MFVDNRLLNICVKEFYLGLEIGLEAEAKTFEAEARTLEAEAEAEAKTLEAEAEAGHFGLEAEARPRGLTSLVSTARDLGFSQVIVWIRVAVFTRHWEGVLNSLKL